MLGLGLRLVRLGLMLRLVFSVRVSGIRVRVSVVTVRVLVVRLGVGLVWLVLVRVSVVSCSEDPPPAPILSEGLLTRLEGEGAIFLAYINFLCQHLSKEVPPVQKDLR